MVVALGNLNEVQGEELMCHEITTLNYFDQIANLETIESVQNCQAQLLNIQAQESEITSIIAVNGTALDTTEIESLYLNESTVSFMPTGFTNVLPNLKFVNFIAVGLQQLDKGNLEQFGSSLLVLDVSSNQISHLEADLFEYNQNLKAIGLSNNAIEFIDSAFFDNLRMMNSLFVLVLQNAGCMDQNFERTNPEDLLSFEWDTDNCSDGSETEGTTETEQTTEITESTSTSTEIDEDLNSIQTHLSAIDKTTLQVLENGQLLSENLDKSTLNITSTSENIGRQLTNNINSLSDSLHDFMNDYGDVIGDSGNNVLIAVAGGLSILSLTVSAFVGLKNHLSCRGQLNDLQNEWRDRASSNEMYAESMKLLLDEIKQVKMNLSNSAAMGQDRFCINCECKTCFKRKSDDYGKKQDSVDKKFDIILNMLRESNV